MGVYEKIDSIEFNQKPPLLAFYCIGSLCVFTAELGFSSQKATAALAGVSQFKNYKGDKKMTGDLTILAQLRSSHQFENRPKQLNIENNNSFQKLR